MPTDDCFDCLDITDMAGNKIKRSNVKGKSDILIEAIEKANKNDSPLTLGFHVGSKPKGDKK